jgi:hypothetical protein
MLPVYSATNTTAADEIKYYEPTHTHTHTHTIKRATLQVQLTCQHLSSIGTQTFQLLSSGLEFINLLVVCFIRLRSVQEWINDAKQKSK